MSLPKAEQVFFY